MAKNHIIKTNLIVILIALFSQSYSQSVKEFKNYYQSDKIYIESTFEKLSNHKIVTEYFESGKIRSKKTYLIKNNFDTQIEGEEITYFENGTIQLYYFWKDGAPSGRIYCNYPNGQLAYEKFFSKKFKTGIWKFYNQDGVLYEEMGFTNNKTFWDSSNDYAINKYYFNGKLAYTVELIAGKKANLKIIDQISYNKLITSELSSGQVLFSQNCIMCHSADVDIVGPKLRGVTNSRNDDWLTKMITNGDALQKSGDKEAEKLYKKWGQAQHPNFEHLNTEEIKTIIEYLKTLK